MANIRTLLFCLLLPVALSGQEEIISIDTGAFVQEGTLLVPESDGAVPLVMIIPGSGPTDRDGNNSLMKNNSLKMLAEGLNENGIATLRYDKRGVSGGNLTPQQILDTRFEDFISDAKNWIDHLQNLEGVSDIHILGHSQGSLVGIMAAQGGQVKSLISLAGLGAPVDEIIREQLKVQPPLLQEQADIILDSLAQGHEVKKVHPMLISLFNPGVQPFLRSFMQYDPSSEIAKLDIPVLILNGTEDIQVGVDQAEKLHASCTNSKMVILEKMNHVLKEVEGDRLANQKTYFDPELPLIPGLVPAIVEFMNTL